MTREETAAIIKALRLAYPGFYSKFKPGDYTDLIALWATMFRDDDAQNVTQAVYQLIQTHNGFPPEIADVKSKIREMEAAVTGDPTDEELWFILRKSLTNGVYGADEEFARLPTVLQRYCGSPSWLRDHALMDRDVIDSVVHGQFLKQITSIRERQKFLDGLSPEMLAAMEKAFGRLPSGYTPMTENQFNTARNNVLDRLLDVKILQ